METFGKSKKSGGPRKAPKINKYNFHENYMQETQKVSKGKSPQSPMSRKRLSK